MGTRSIWGGDGSDESGQDQIVILIVQQYECIKY